MIRYLETKLYLDYIEAAKPKKAKEFKAQTTVPP